MKVQKSTVVLLTLFFISLYGIGIAAADDPITSCSTLPEAYDAMESDAVVTVKTVTEESWKEANFYYTFEPNNVAPTTGFIIYPGAFIDPIAYAPPAHEIAAEGYLVIVVKMPNNLSVLGLNRANKIISAYDEIENWIISGHSLGGSMACYYAHDFTDKLEGIVIWAAVPTEESRLDDTNLKAISIYGTKNLNPEKIEALEKYLPPGSPFIEIEGGNHSYFGWYDANSCPEDMDRIPADITIEEQQAIIIQSTVGFLNQFDISPASPTCTAEKIYGVYSKETELLRFFRDNVLGKTPEGRELIRLYYDWSPAITEVMDKDEALKENLKELIDGVLGLTNEAIK